MPSFDELWASLRDSDYVEPFMLIDCAGVEGGRGGLPDASFTELESLFTGDLAIELADVGPYLGRLCSFDDAVARISADMLAHHVGMLVLVPDGKNLPTFAQLHRHFRKFNVVYDPSGKPLFFRYYDPRVIVDVLSVLNAKQVEDFFGPIDALVLIGSDGQLTRCSRQDGALVVDIL